MEELFSGIQTKGEIQGPWPRYLLAGSLLTDAKIQHCAVRDGKLVTFPYFTQIKSTNGQIKVTKAQWLSYTALISSGYILTDGYNQVTGVRQSFPLFQKKDHPPYFSLINSINIFGNSADISYMNDYCDYYLNYDLNALLRIQQTCQLSLLVHLIRLRHKQYGYINFDNFYYYDIFRGIYYAINPDDIKQVKLKIINSTLHYYQPPLLNDNDQKTFDLYTEYIYSENDLAWLLLFQDLPYIYEDFDEYTIEQNKARLKEQFNISTLKQKIARFFASY